MSTATDTMHPLKAAIENKTALVGIVGLGYVGLPLGRAFMDAGFTTMGFDVDQTKVDRLMRGDSYIGHIEGGWFAERIQQKQFEPTADMARLSEADAILICVPTPLSYSRDPDLSLCRSHHTKDRRSAAARTTCCAGKYDLSRYNTRRDAPDLKAIWSEAKERTSSWPTARSAKIQAISTSRPTEFRKWWEVSTR